MDRVLNMSDGAIINIRRQTTDEVTRAKAKAKGKSKAAPAKSKAAPKRSPSSASTQ